MPATSARGGDGYDPTSRPCERGAVDRVGPAPDSPAAAGAHGVGGAQLEVRPLRGVVVAHHSVERLQTAVDPVDPALLEHDPGRRQDHRLPRPAHRREAVAAGRLAGDDDHRVAHGPDGKRAPVERRHAGAAQDERRDGDPPGRHPQPGRVADEQRGHDQERPSQRGHGEADGRRDDQPCVAGHSVTRPCSAASRAGPMPLTWSSSSSDRKPP